MEERDGRAQSKLYVLDTNVLMHDPSCIFRFQEHDVLIPMVVLEELDAHKKGLTETARNVRQVSRNIADLMEDVKDIEMGLPIPRAEGRLFFQITAHKQTLPPEMASGKSDNEILAVILELVEQYQGRAVILVSKDINLRIKGRALGLRVEDYTTDQALDDLDLLYTGVSPLSPNFWQEHSKALESWQEDGRYFYRIKGPATLNWKPNELLFSEDDSGFEAIVRTVSHEGAVIERVHDYINGRQTVWGIKARNREQNFALNLLMDPDIDFVSILGQAGTGKTLLTLASGLHQVMDEKRYNEIIITRATVPVGEDIGYLPGTEEEKMMPWMGALEDNLELLSQSDTGGGAGNWGREATQDLLAKRIRVKSMSFMRGRTFLNKFVIIDEAQNLTPKQMKTLVTRAGSGSKMVCLGNIAQIDTPYLTEITSGLTYAVDRFKTWEHSGHITLRRGERSRLADFASEAM